MAVKHPRINPPYNPKAQWPLEEDYGEIFPNRMCVCRDPAPWNPDPWEVWEGDYDLLGTFPTFTEAINWAQKEARK